MVLRFLKQPMVGMISKTIIHFVFAEVLVWACDSFYLCLACLDLITVSVSTASGPMLNSKMRHVLPLCSAMNQNKLMSDDKRSRSPYHNPLFNSIYYKLNNMKKI